MFDKKMRPDQKELTDDFILRYLNLLCEQQEILARGFCQKEDSQHYALNRDKLLECWMVVDAELECRNKKDNGREPLS